MIRTASPIGTQVLLHADDFGMNPVVNQGIIAGFSHGVLTSTSILANAPDFTDAVTRWSWLDDERAAGRMASVDARRSLGDRCASPFDLGVHLNLTEGTPLTPDFPSECLDASGRFSGLGVIARRLLLTPHRWRPAIERELSAQVARVVDAGLRPTHLNGHQYVELFPALAEPIINIAARFRIPVVRVASERGVWRALVLSRLASRWRERSRHASLCSADEYRGTAHAGRVSLDLMRRWTSGLPQGCTLEVGLHPGLAPVAPSADGWRDPLGALRPRELELLQSPELRDLLAAGDLHLGRLSTSLTPHGRLAA